jgi:hypothetical protein
VTELQPFPYDQYRDVMSLCIAVIKGFSPTNLRDSNGLRYNSGGVTASTSETRFQNEFYAAAKRLLGDRIAISSEWGNNGEGSIHFRIVGTGWGVELLRDGDRLAEHCRRFEPGGQYHNAIESGELDDWLVIDCTHRNPCEFTTIKDDRLIHVVFAEDYASAEILDADNEVIAPMFPLL